MINRRSLVIVVLFVLTACGGAPLAESPTTVPAPTAAPAPTAVPTPVALDKADLSAVLSGLTTIPKGLTAGAVTKGEPQAYKQLTRPATINAATLSVVHGSDVAGYVVISLYDDAIKTNDAFTVAKFEITEPAKMTGEKVDEPQDLGKQALALTSTSGLPGTSLTFLRCRAVVYMYLIGDLVDTKSATALAKEIDGRLVPLICQ